MIILPAKIEDSAGIAKVQVDSYTRAYAEILPKPYLNQFTYEEQTQDWSRLIASDTKDILFVAKSENNVIGYALGRSEVDEIPGFEYELVALHVLQGNQRKGVGSQLFLSITQQFQNLGAHSVFLWTLKQNPILKFYEQLEGQFLGEKEWGGNAHYNVAVQEVAYGWRDIDILRQNLAKRGRL